MALSEDKEIQDITQKFIGIIEEHPVKFWTEQLQCSRAAVNSKWKKGTMPNTIMLFRILKVSGISPLWLFFDYGPKKMKDLDTFEDGSLFLNLFPKKVQSFIRQAAAISPPDKPSSIALLISVMNILQEQLQNDLIDIQKNNSPHINNINVEEGLLLFVFDKDFNMVFFNRLAKEHLELTSDIYHQHYNLPIHKDDMNRFNEQIELLSIENNSRSCRARIVFSNGDVVWHNWTIQAIYNQTTLSQIEITGKIIPDSQTRN